ncbi:MAG: hypothetical protein AAF989_16110, partial [Planctomycetota bacterium]
AGVRNVQPRPSVGFKFHAVLVVHSAHLASISSADEDRWLPIFWAIDNFKSSQRRDEKEGDWTLAPVEERLVPSARLAGGRLQDALDRWDEQAADVAVVGLVRNAGAQQVFDLLASYAARDFRSIGHKAIYLSNAFRTLQTIGWDHAEPVMRSLVYAMLNHEGEPNPADSDLIPDRVGRTNRRLLAKLPDNWNEGRTDDAATAGLVDALHDCSPEEASDELVQLIGRGVAVNSIWDALFASAGELSMRQRGIVSLHAVTTTNAMRHAFGQTGDEQTRRFLLLQNASFLAHFREAARDRGRINDRRITELKSDDHSGDPVSVPEIFRSIRQSRDTACEKMHRYLSAGGNPQLAVDHARRLVFLKGNDSHDYKFSSAALEDYRLLSRPWRNRFLAASVFQLRGESDSTRPLVQRIRDALT